jgi:hypothetical protein
MSIIESIVGSIRCQLPPSSGDNLTGFLMDADHFFSEHGAFATVDVRRSEDVTSQLNVTLSISERVQSLQDLAYALGDVWRSIAYQHFEASSVTWFREATVFRFVTVISGELFFVSGTARASGPHYPRLVEAFERDFRLLDPTPGNGVR